MQAKKKFAIGDGPAFDGFSRDQSWNGWECPAFQFDVAEKIIQQHAYVKPDGSKAPAYYDSVRDEFVLYDPLYGFAERYPPITIVFEGESLRVYPIGAFNWIWEEASSC